MERDSAMLNEYNDADVMKDLRHTDVTRGCYGNDNHHHHHHHVGSSRQRHSKVANAPLRFGYRMRRKAAPIITC